jgi:two-component system sensor histidine kinase BaeS
VRLPIATKLFLTLLLATALVVAAMYGFMHWSFQHGFVSFLESRQQERVERMVEQLAEVYVEEGGWDGLRLDRMRWWRLMAGSADVGDRAEDAPSHEHPRRRSGRGPREMDTGLALLDADKTILIGRVPEAGALNLTPIQIDGRTVGFVGRMPGPMLRERVDVRFVEAQRRSFLGIALLVGILAVALAWPLANTLVRPLKRIAEAARGLAAGRFTTRAAVTGNDELSDLGRDFNAMAHTLERTETARRQWMADISHELRTPLALLRAELEAMQDGVRPLSGDSVASLQADVARLNRLVDDLYQLSMTDLGALSYQKRPVDPLGLLRDAVESLVGEYERHDLQIAVRDELAERGGHPARRSRPLVAALPQPAAEQFALYRCRRGSLEIAQLAEGPPSGWTSISAIPRPACRRKRWGNCSSASTASTPRAIAPTGGAGLGLAICRNIVAAHDGRIEARPSSARGVCVRVELPLADMNVKADHGRILIVEDESQAGAPACRLPGCRRLRRRQPRRRPRGRTPGCATHSPDLIVLDLMLPGRDGLELCRDIRAFSRVPIIMATARAEEIDRLLGLELGADDYICKPYSPREVVARIKAVLRRARPEARGADGTGLSLDKAAYKVRAGAAEVELTAVEFHLFATLYGEPGRIYSRAQLMDRIYADQRVVSDRTIDSHIKKLRKKLAELLPGEELIHSVYGAGYRYEPNPVRAE